jgi:hypothetical protein
MRGRQRCCWNPLLTAVLIYVAYDAREARSQNSGGAGMIAFGCLAPLILCVVGALIGHLMGGVIWAMWGFVIGLAVGVAILGFSWLVLEKAKEES